MKSFASALLSTLAICFFTVTTFAQSEDPFVGTWDIDLAASNFGGAQPPNNMSRTYADLGNSTFMYLVATLNANGMLSGSSATYKFDGQRYPIASVDADGGQQTTISYHKLNERTAEYTVRAGEVITQIGAKTITPDGRVLRIAIQFPGSPTGLDNQILVFNRRR